MGKALDKLGQLLVQQGIVTRAQFEACVAEALKSVQRGASLAVSDVIVSRGFAERDKITEVLAASGSLTLFCRECNASVSLEPLKLGADPHCSGCGAPLDDEAAPEVSRGTPAKSAPTKTPSEVLEAAKDPKRKLGKYTLLKELGRGGYAVVYKAWDDTLQQHVAVKILRVQDIGLSDTSTDSDLQEFFREARTAVKLNHPNIVRIFELGHHEDRHFLSMELIDGPSLTELMKQEKAAARGLPFYAHSTKYLKILRDVALALHHAHRQAPPIVHRDVKPQNILIDRSGRACVVDFGLAKELRPGRGHTLTNSGITKGTPCYMSPEQATGKGPPLDARTDVYSLGAVFYELLAGQPPFTGPTSRDILNKVVSEEAIPPSDVLKSRGSSHRVIPELEQICLRALEKDRDRRYPTAKALADDVDRFLEGKSVRAKAVPGYERTLRWAKRRWAVVVPALFALAMGLIAVVAVARSGREPVVERVFVKDEAETRYREAVKEIDARTRDMNFDAAVKTCEKALQGLPEGSQKEALRRRLDDLALQDHLLKGVIERIKKTPQEYERFQLKRGAPLLSVRAYNATAGSLLLRQGDRVMPVDWGDIAHRQFVRLVQDCWPDLSGRASLALGVWCLRNDLTDDAAVFLNRPGGTDAQAQRYRAELSAKTKSGDATLDEQIARLLEQAEKALSSGDAVVARARFERVLALRPDDPSAAAGLKLTAALESKSAPKQPEPQPAPAPVARASKGVAASPEAAQALERAMEKANLGEWAEAIADCTEVINKEPDVVDAYFRRGTLRHMCREWGGALQDYSRGLELDPGHMGLHGLRAMVYYNVGKWSLAIAGFREGIQVAAEPDPWYSVHLWFARARLGEIKDANRELRAAAATWKPDIRDGPFIRSSVDYILGDLSEVDFQKSAGSDTKIPMVAQRQCLTSFMIASKRLIMGDKTGAATFFQKCLDAKVYGMNVDLCSELELDRLNGKPMPSLDPPKPPKPPAPPSPKIPSILSLVKNSDLVTRYDAVRTSFAEALKDRDLAKAARQMAEFEKSIAEADTVPFRAAAQKALARIAAASFGDPAVRDLAKAAEDWLAGESESPELLRGLAFDLRDVALVSIAFADFGEAVGRLNAAGVHIKLFPYGRTGGYRKSPKGFAAYEIVESGGQKAEVGGQASLWGEAGPRIQIQNIVSVLRTDRSRRGVDPIRGPLTDFLLLTYDAGRVPEDEALNLRPEEFKRLRMSEYLDRMNSRGCGLDLLSTGMGEHWKIPGGAPLEKEGLVLPPSRRLSIFKSGAFMSGYHLDLEFQTADSPPVASAKMLICLTDEAGQDWRAWMEVVPATGTVSWAHGSTRRFQMPPLAPGSRHLLSLYVQVSHIAVALDGKVVGRTWSVVDSARSRPMGYLALGADGGSFRISKLRVAEGGDASAFGFGGALLDTSRYRARWKDREAAVARGGGTRATEGAVTAALHWLARHQMIDGGWEAESFTKTCTGGTCGGPGERDWDTGVTALSILAFLGAGTTHLSQEEVGDQAIAGRVRTFGDTVRKGLTWLISHQDPEGCIGERGMKYMYNHAVSTLCLAEAYGMTQSPILKEPAQKAVDFLISAQNPGQGWRYSSKCGDNDTSVTGWAILALKAAELADLSFPKTAYESALRWLNSATEQNGYYQTGYNARSTGKVFEPGRNEQFDHHATMTAISVMSRLAMQKRNDPALGGINLLTSDVAEWKTNKIDFCFWFWSSTALYLHDAPDGKAWKGWIEPVKNALVPNQSGLGKGCRRGSWDPDQERWGMSGGRVYATAINALTLETPYRLVYSPAPPKK